MTTDGSTPAAAATTRTVVRSYPRSANVARAAASTASRLARDRSVNAITASYANNCWQTRRGTSTVKSTVVGKHLEAVMAEIPTEVPTDIPAGTSRMVDVLVVGAGPAGLTASAVLAGRGVSHLTVDRAPPGSNTSRAAVVHARTLEVLEEVGVAGPLVERGVIVPTFTLRDRDRTLATITFDELPTRYPYTLMVPQNVTERVLADRLAEFGGELAAGWRLDTLDLGTAPGRARAALVDDRGRRTLVEARYVVGADGMHSTVRGQAGISFDGAAYPQSFVLADVRLDWDLPAAEVQLFFSPAGL